jgi:PAS domain-containing protein
VTSVDGSLASALVAALPDGVLVIDPAGVVIGANRAAGELFGLRRRRADRPRPG